MLRKFIIEREIPGVDGPPSSCWSRIAPGRGIMPVELWNVPTAELP
jgi:hypothetical protein